MRRTDARGRSDTPEGGCGCPRRAARAAARSVQRRAAPHDVARRHLAVAPGRGGAAPAARRPPPRSTSRRAEARARCLAGDPPRPRCTRRSAAAGDPAARWRRVLAPPGASGDIRGTRARGDVRREARHGRVLPPERAPVADPRCPSAHARLGNRRAAPPVVVGALSRAPPPDALTACRAPRTAEHPTDAISSARARRRRARRASARAATPVSRRPPR